MLEGGGKGGGGGGRDKEILLKDNVGVGREKVREKGLSGFIFWGEWEKGVSFYPPTACPLQMSITDLSKLVNL